MGLDFITCWKVSFIQSMSKPRSKNATQCNKVFVSPTFFLFHSLILGRSVHQCADVSPPPPLQTPYVAENRGSGIKYGKKGYL